MIEVRARLLHRDRLLFLIGVVATPLLLSPLGLSTRQLLATGGFSVILYGAIFFWRLRLSFAFAGVTLLLLLGLLDIEHLVEFAGLEIILFLVCMMLVIGFLEENQFFEYVIERLLKMVGPHPHLILGTMMTMAAVSAALVDEVTSILFMVAALLNLLGRSKISPVPFIMMLVFATNIGSSATVVGNPIGVIIALRSDLTFLDFLRWATPISIVCLFAAIPLCLWFFRSQVAALSPILEGRRGEQRIEHVVEEEMIPRHGIRRSAVLLGCVVGGLIMHHPLETLLDLPRNTMFLGVAFAGGCAALVLTGAEARKLVETRVDWWTLLFFMMLFASVGTLAQQDITGVIAGHVIGVSDGRVPVLTVFFAWTSGALTAVMDNVLAVATFVPIVEDVGKAGVGTFPLWWAMLFGGTLMGNLTLIGSTANIVAVGVIERRRLGEVTFGEWVKAGALIAIPTLVIATLLLLIQLPLMPDT
jgi:Na+/H+ antiporter NhaD/arsenite permease-like protein